MRAGLAFRSTSWNRTIGRGNGARETFRANCATKLAPFEMVKEVRGMGLLSELSCGTKKVVLRMPLKLFHRIHPAMFGQIL